MPPAPLYPEEKSALLEGTERGSSRILLVNHLVTYRCSSPPSGESGRSVRRVVERERGLLATRVDSSRPRRSWRNSPGSSAAVRVTSSFYRGVENPVGAGNRVGPPPRDISGERRRGGSAHSRSLVFFALDRREDSRGRSPLRLLLATPHCFLPSLNFHAHSGDAESGHFPPLSRRTRGTNHPPGPEINEDHSLGVLTRFQITHHHRTKTPPVYPAAPIDEGCPQKNPSLREPHPRIESPRGTESAPDSQCRHLPSRAARSLPRCLSHR